MATKATTKEEPVEEAPAEDAPKVSEEAKAAGAQAMEQAKINHPEMEFNADPLTGAPLIPGISERFMPTVESGQGPTEEERTAVAEQMGRAEPTIEENIGVDQPEAPPTEEK